MMIGKECRATRREIDESELNQGLSDQARLHVSLCPSCRGFQAERTGLRELVGSLEPVAAPGDFDLRLRARLAGEQQSRARQPFIFRLLTRTPALAAAAVVVMLALSLVWLAPRNKTQAPNTAVTSPKEVPNIPDQPRIATIEGSDPGQTGAVTKPGNRTLRDENPFRESSGKSASAGIKSVDYGVSPAEYFRQEEQRAGEVSLSAPVKPMVVSIQDDHGQMHKISLPPVSFGAQRPVDNRIAVSSTNSRSW